MITGIQNFFKKLRSFDWWLMLLSLLISAAGIAFIYSATWTSERSDLREAFQRQAVYVGVGMGLALIIGLIDYARLIKLRWVWAVLAVGLLVLVLAIGREVYGSKSWIILGPLSLQPAELTKIAYIVFLSGFLASRGKEITTFKTFCLACMAMGTMMLLILKQPDLGSAAVFAPITFCMMWVGGVAKRWLLLGALVGVIGFAGAFVFVLKPYQKARLMTFLQPELDVRGAGYHLHQSKIAIGSGGLAGKGFREGTQNMLGFLPRNVSFSDFIFSVIGEEFGFIGGAALIGAFSVLLLFGLRIAMRARDMAGSLIATGVVALLFAHIFENIGMTIGVTPITGIPLPFISYGGTFVLACFMGIGLLQSVNVHQKKT
jgi:rod shape determining protein RodA